MNTLHQHANGFKLKTFPFRSGFTARHPKAAFFNFLFISSLVLSPSFAYTQLPDTYAAQDSLFKKASTQRTIAWVLLGGGAAATLGGTFVAVGNFWVDIAKGGSSKGAVAFFTGLAMMGVSVPLFVSSGKNRRQAVSLTLKTVPTPSNYLPHGGTRASTALGIRVRL